MWGPAYSESAWSRDALPLAATQVRERKEGCYTSLFRELLPNSKTRVLGLPVALTAIAGCEPFQLWPRLAVQSQSLPSIPLEPLAAHCAVR